MKRNDLESRNNSKCHDHFPYRIQTPREKVRLTPPSHHTPVQRRYVLGSFGSIQYRLRLNWRSISQTKRISTVSTMSAIVISRCITPSNYGEITWNNYHQPKHEIVVMLCSPTKRYQMGAPRCMLFFQATVTSLRSTIQGFFPGEERQRWYRHLPGRRSRGPILRQLPIVLREGLLVVRITEL